VSASNIIDSVDITSANMYCIIGAGASGLAVAKNFVAAGIPFEVLEREPDIGGLWNIATPTGMVYETAHLVSAKHSTGWDDYPMDDLAYPEYPSHARVLGYFRDYIRHFGLAPYIHTGKTVASVTRTSDGRWAVTVAGEASTRIYKGVVLANGHHCAPRMPTYPGTFDGEIIHSSSYRSPKQLRDKRVLVVGAGNSACDIARDAAHSSGTPVFMSMRRGHWFVPKSSSPCPCPTSCAAM
jgi:cation diffusion facilitator CzcD-associated flavoprotein CzcO